MDKIKKEKSMQEKIPEIFKIEKKGEKTKTKKLYPKEEIESVNKKEVIKKENKQLKVILGVIGILILAFLLVLLINYKTVNFNVEGVDFKIIQEGDLLFYNTFIKLYSQVFRGKFSSHSLSSKQANCILSVKLPIFTEISEVAA